MSSVLFLDAFGIVPNEHSDQFPVRARDRGDLQIVLPHVASHLADRNVRAERARPRTHDLLDRPIGLPIELFRPEETEDDVLLVDDDARVPSRVADTLCDVAEALVDAACGYVLAGHVPGSRALGIPALRREIGRKPIQFARDVVVDLLETQTLEPPRGSWAEVSGAVPAIDDHRTSGVE